MSTDKALRILMLGPRTASVGGTTVAFNQLVGEIQAFEQISIEIIDTARNEPTKAQNIRRGLTTLTDLFLSCRSADVVTFHASARGVIVFGPIVAMVCWLHRRPWILRAFGGNLDEVYAHQPRIVRMLVNRTALSADLCLVESRSLVSYFEPRCRKRIEWFPNSRPIPDTELATDTEIAHKEKDEHRRFVYLGIVKPSKGMYELIEAASRLYLASGGKTSVDVYGPLADGMFREEFEGVHGLTYRGAIKPDEVHATLASYDALVFPTKYEGEGYPGVVLEAYSVGIPVVASRWRSIPEIVDERAGILVEPGDVPDLVRAMKSLLDTATLNRLKEGAVDKRQQFASNRWSASFVAWCRELVENSSGRRGT